MVFSESEPRSGRGSDTESDQQADILSKKKKPSGKNILQYKNPCFVERIICEDSRVELAVVDLFIAVKKMKNKVDSLEESNSRISEKMFNLSQETTLIKKEYSDLLDNIQKFLNELNDLKDVTEVKEIESEIKRLDTTSTELRIQADDGTDVTLGSSELLHPIKTCTCSPSLDSDSGKEELNLTECLNGGGSLADCLGNLLSELREKHQSEMLLRETVLGSMIASLLWLRRKEGYYISTKSIEHAFQDPGESEGSPKLSDSNIEIICDICKILGGATIEGINEMRSQQTSEAIEHGDQSTGVSCLYRSEDRRQQSTVWTVDADESSIKTVQEDAGSDGDSIFEEALSDPESYRCDLKAKPSVTCMGDLLKEAVRKKSASTLTANNADVVSSWMGTLADEIKSKIKAVKSKTNVLVTEEKTDKDLSKLEGALEFTVTANTPVGVFDVTVVQYKNSRAAKSPSKFESSTGAVHGGGSTDDEDPTAKAVKMKEDDLYFSESSFEEFSDSESSKRSSHLSDEEMEEFLEVRLTSSKHAPEKAPERSPQKGVLMEENLKEAKALLFEIYKPKPMVFVEKMIQKLPRLPRKDEATVKGQNHFHKIVAFKTGEKQEKEVVIQGSSSDLVLYIQVKVEKETNPNADGNETKSQRSPTKDEKDATDERIIKLEQNERSGESLYAVWKGCYEEETEERRITFNEPAVLWENSVPELKEDELAEEREVKVKEPKEKSVTFSEVLAEIFLENDMQDEVQELERGTASVIVFKNPKLSAQVWFRQSESQWIQRTQVTTRQEPDREESKTKIREPLESGSGTLGKALNLIREIENDIVEVKLNNAIAILPQLESELRKHLQQKIKELTDTECGREKSAENFFSALDFRLEEESTEDEKSETSEQRFGILLKLLADLEEAVKSSECLSHSSIPVCEFSSSRVYDLLHALTINIQEVEEDANLSSFSQTLEIASRLDTAVREYDGFLKKQSLDLNPFERKVKHSWTAVTDREPEMLEENDLNSMKKKMFEMVEEEAIDTEGRLEKDFDRINLLEKENEEAMMFLETFLQKTQRRATELENLKTDLKKLSSLLKALYETISNIKLWRAEHESKNRKEEVSTETLPSNGKAAPEESVRETVSGLLIAINSLKSKAREKNAICKKILSSGGQDKASIQRSSKSSFTAKNAETLTCRLTELKRIGQTSFYLAWTKPEGRASDSVVGYEIHVNGKLNHKVRNPRRLQAVLYSVNFTQNLQIELHALVENGSKYLLLTATYLDK